MQIDYKKAGLCYTIGSFFNKGISFLTVPIFTKLLSTADYGIVSTYSSWVSIVSVCIGLTLYMAVRQAFIDFPDKVDDLHATITIFITIVSGSVFVFCVLIGKINNVNLLLPLLCIVQSYAGALIEDYSVYLMMKYKYRARTAIMVLPNLLSVILAIIIINYMLRDRLYLGRILPTACITFLFGIMVIFSVFTKSRKFDFSLLKYGLAISVPLIAHGVALTLLGQSDRTMITALVGADKTGIYSVIYNFSMIATALTSALSGIWSPWYLARLKGHTPEDFCRINYMTKIYVLFMTAILCGVILVAPEILKWLTPEPYWEGISIIPPIVLANFVTFVYTFYVDIEHIHRKTMAIAINTMTAAVCNIVLNYIFIPFAGYEAAAYTTIASYIISLLLHYFQAKKLEPQASRLLFYTREFLIVITISIVYYFSLELWFIRWSIAAVLGVGILAYLLKQKIDNKLHF